MANPQIENGHVDIANDLVEALAKIRLSGEESQVLWSILRKTYGWHKKEDHISLSQFALMTGIKRQNVLRAITKLSSKKIIAVIKKDDSIINIYRIQKDFDNWQPLSKKITLSSIKITPVINIDNRVSSKMMHTKETITKENIQKKTYTVDFVLFWLRYPKKVGKKAAYKAWLKAKDKPDIKIIFAALADQKRSEQWTKNNGQYIPNPATWINQGRWDDEIITNLNQTISTPKIFPNCPICNKETTQADIDKLGSCPACYKPLPPEKLKELLSNIGKEIK